MSQVISPNLNSSVAFDWLSEVKYVVENSTGKEIVVDITTVDRISSEDLNELIPLQLKLRHQGRRLVLENVQHQVRKVFALTRLDRLIEIRETQPTDHYGFQIDA